MSIDAHAKPAKVSLQCAPPLATSTDVWRVSSTDECTTIANSNYS
jgi:hypothetical protein